MGRLSSNTEIVMGCARNCATHRISHAKIEYGQLRVIMHGIYPWRTQLAIAFVDSGSYSKTGLSGSLLNVIRF